MAKALELCNDEQYRLLQECYGKDDPICVESVKDLFVELGIPQLFKEEQQSFVTKAHSELDRIREEEELSELNPQMFLFLLDKITARKS